MEKETKVTSSSSMCSSKPTPTTASVMSTLPPEILKIIFDEMKDDTASLVRVSNTCTAWSDILKKDKTNYLFPLVFPHVHKYLSRNDTLSCRQICKTWKFGVDQIISQPNRQWNPLFDSSWFQELELRAEIPNLDYSWNGFNTFYSTEQLDRFLTQMMDNSGNPFPAKAVLFLSPYVPEFLRRNIHQRLMNQFINMHRSFNQLCTRFGGHVSKFIYVSRISIVDPMLLEQILRNMPNLQAFELFQDDLTEMEDNYYGLVNPVPPLLRLRELAIHGAHFKGLFETLLDAYGQQLEYLDCENGFLVDYTESVNIGPSYGSLRLHQLKELKIRNRDQYDQRSPYWLHCLTSWHMPLLEKLSIESPTSSIYGMIPVRAFIGVVNHFASSIVGIYLPIPQYEFPSFPTYWNEMDLIGFQNEMNVELPMLEILGVSYFVLERFSVLLRIVRKCPNLRRLELYKTSSIADEDCESMFPASEIIAPLWEAVHSLIEVIIWKGCRDRDGNLVPETQLLDWRATRS